MPFGIINGRHHNDQELAAERRGQTYVFFEQKIEDSTKYYHTVLYCTTCTRPYTLHGTQPSISVRINVRTSADMGLPVDLTVMTRLFFEST